MKSPRKPRPAAPVPIARVLGDAVRKLRQARGLTQRELAERAGVSLTFLQNIEAGRRWVGPRTIAALAGNLGVAQAALFASAAEDGEPLETGDRVRASSGAESGGSPIGTALALASTPDPRERLVMIARTLGVALTPEAARRLPVTEPWEPRGRHFRAMPADIYIRLRDLCRAPVCDWARLRRTLRGFR